MPDRNLPVIQPGAGSQESAKVPVFARIGIIGLGLIGGSIALAARQIWPASLVIGVDNKEILEKAMVLHAIDVAADNLTVISEADLIILAAPVCQNLTLISELSDYVPGSTVVTDVGSTKRAISEAARCLPERLTFVGGHPLGGAARQGIEHARPDLFAKRPWLFTPSSGGFEETLEQLHQFVEAFGAHPVSMTVEEHDALLANLSHLPQLTISVMLHVIGESVGREGLALSGRGLADPTRLASSPASVWNDICSTNSDFIGGALDELIAALSDIRTNLKSTEAIDKVFASANKWRELLPPRGGKQSGASSVGG